MIYCRIENNLRGLKFNPDLVIVEWCCNDGKESLYKQATYESKVRRFLEEGTALIMLSMATQIGNSSQILHEPISDWYDVPMLSYRDAYYQDARIITLKEIYEEKIAGARIIDLGFFGVDEETKSYGFCKSIEIPFLQELILE